MKTFEYIAFDNHEKKTRGILSAENSREAQNILEKRDLIPLKIKISSKNISNLKVNSRQLSVFTKQLASLLAAGTPLEKTLQILSNQTNDRKISQLTTLLLEDIQSGQTLSFAMSKFPKVFTNIYTSAILAGESSASLPSIFSDLSEFIDKEEKIKSQVTSALVYPILLLGVSLLVIYALVSLVLPQVVEQFLSTNIELPLLTKILLSLSNVFPLFLIAIVLLIITSLVFFRTNLMSESFKIRISSFLLKIPLFGSLILFNQTARFCSSMHLMTSAGLNTVDSLQIAKDTFTNKCLKSEIEFIIKRVLSGSSISHAFSQSKVFPNIFIQLIASGDVGSQISQMFKNIHIFLNEEVEAKRNIMLTLLQPLVILFMGVFVMLIVMAIMLPLLQMNNLIFTL
jgi:general secretion pathway protein F